MPIPCCRYVCRTLITIALALACFPANGAAEEAAIPARTLTPLIGAPSLSIRCDIVSISDRIELGDRVESRDSGTPSRLGVFLPLYVSFAGLQALDAHSTLRALRAGGSERNPLLRDLADRPAGLVALKAGVTASTILLVEKMRVKNRVGAMVLMAALDSVYAMVVVHNYRAIP